MELTREDYAEAFGLSDEERAAWEAQDSPEGHQEPQEGSETGTDTQDGPESRQEPQEGPEGGQGTGDTEEGGEAQEGTRERREMPPEERHRQAEARRARERAEMERAAQEAAQARVDEAYRVMFAGQTNPYTGQPIQSEADYRAWQAEKQRRDSEEQLRAAGIDPQTLQGAVDRQMQPLRPGQIQRGNDPGPPLPGGDQIDVVGSLGL